MHLLNHWPQQLQTLQVHRSHGVEDNASCDLDLGVKVKSNISCKCISPKPLVKATSKFAGA